MTQPFQIKSGDYVVSVNMEAVEVTAFEKDGKWSRSTWSGRAAVPVIDVPTPMAGSDAGIF
jgi:hypothetical protein